MDPDRRRLDPDRMHTFRLRVVLGQVTRVEAEGSARDLADRLREGAEAFARRAEALAVLLEGLAGRGWRLAADGIEGGRVARPARGFATPEGRVLPEEVTLVKDALPSQIAVDLVDLRSPGIELGEGLHVRVETLELPARVVDGTVELVYTPREYLMTFSPGA